MKSVVISSKGDTVWYWACLEDSRGRIVSRGPLWLGWKLNSTLNHSSSLSHGSRNPTRFPLTTVPIQPHVLVRLYLPFWQTPLSTSLFHRILRIWVTCNSRTTSTSSLNDGYVNLRSWHVTQYLRASYKLTYIHIHIRTQPRNRDVSNFCQSAP